MEQENLAVYDVLRRIEANTLLAAKKVLTLDDMVIFTGLSKTHLYKLTHTRAIPFYRPNGKNLYFDKMEIENWLKQGKVDSVSEIDQQATNYLITKRK